MADDLEQLLNRAITADQFRKRYAVVNGVTEFETAWSNLDHFLSDEDIRERDSSYREMQESELKKFISLLRSGTDDAEINKINFLWYSDEFLALFMTLPIEIRATPTFETVSRFLRRKRHTLRITSITWLAVGVIGCSFWLLTTSASVHWPLLLLGAWSLIGANIYSRSNRLALTNEEIGQGLHKVSARAA